MLFYDRKSAVEYALAHAQSYSRYFHTYDHTRGDCTNFVSQALWAGGWPMVLQPGNDSLTWAAQLREDAYEDIAGWNYKHDCSRPWLAADDFKRYVQFSGRCTVSTRFNMQPGDVAQLVIPDGTATGGEAHHSMMITKVTPPGDGGGIGGANIWFTYHTKNKINVPLAEIESLMGSDQLLFWKVADCIPPIPSSAWSYGPPFSKRFW